MELRRQKKSDSARRRISHSESNSESKKITLDPIPNDVFEKQFKKSGLAPDF